MIRRKMTALDNGNLTDNPQIKNISRFRHWHPEIEFVYVRKGKLLLEHGNELVPIKAGQMFMISNNVPHTYMDCDVDSDLHMLKISMDKKWVSHEKGLTLTLFEQSFLIERVDDKIRNIYEAIMEADAGPYTELLVVSKIYELFVYLQEDGTDTVVPMASHVIGERNVVYQIDEFLKSNLKQDVSLEMLAEHLGLSKNYCSKVIKEKTTLNYSEYLNHIRVKEAENLLTQTDMGILDICFMAGFKSVQSFNRNFRQFLGVSPREYRKIYVV